MSDQGWWISHTVLLEAEWVLRSAYGFEPDAIATVVENLLMGAAIAWQDEGVVERAIALYKSKRMDFADVLHAVQTPKEIKFATFDKRFAKSMKDSKRPVVVAY